MHLLLECAFGPMQVIHSINRVRVTLFTHPPRGNPMHFTTVYHHLVVHRSSSASLLLLILNS